MGERLPLAASVHHGGACDELAGIPTRFGDGIMRDRE